MFSVEERVEVRAQLLRLAHDDERIDGAAITGSGAHGGEDRWSDIDLFFGVVEGADLAGVLEDWTEVVYREMGAIHHFDVLAEPATYRAFLLPDCLEVDLGFTPTADFGPNGPTFRSVFGKVVDGADDSVPDRGQVIGLAWHHVLHARICIERHKVWQAEYWISALRDHALTLACLRYSQPVDYAKGVDALPPDVTAGFDGALVRFLSDEELRRALRVATQALFRELNEVDPALAEGLRSPLLELAEL
jgi:hypothetical protein